MSFTGVNTHQKSIWNSNSLIFSKSVFQITHMNMQFKLDAGSDVISYTTCSIRDQKLHNTAHVTIHAAWIANFECWIFSMNSL